MIRKFAWTFATVATLTLSCHAKLNVVATTPDLGALAQAIGGDHIQLTTLAKPTEDAHFVEPKPSFIVKLNRADVLIEGGAELESGWLNRLVDEARNAKITSGKPGRIAAAEGITLLEVPSNLDRSKGDVHAAGNPHFLTDPLNAKIVAEHICKSFCQIDSSSCSQFQANLKRFLDSLDGSYKKWSTLLAPHKGTKVVTYHNNWLYFAKRFDLQMDLFLEPKPGVPPSPAHLAAVIQKMKAENARVIVVQPYLNRRIAETVAGHTSATVLDWPAFPGSKNNADYIAWVDELVKSLSDALNRK